MTITSIPQLIKTARNGRSQAEFARELGVEQSTLSRYEKGEANPKAPIIERCMHLVHWNNQAPVPTVEELADKVRERLSREDQAHLRVALSKLIDGLVSEKTGARNLSHHSS
ncbi:helix-turn-helix domain-containing protein [Sulfurirhabdus autotrophica]|uniref:Helix-turn-helix protein n=1 Tax=Sulfurirhabdus autotrophica TaxID=1706046 RepID=A0A4R3XRA2_9PROT|nr:helix-turn-helix domain-containing protein [Sulfurirhabdus autotrophica]TCV79205.1 helix-turn-helix protein [Sulfurirhabdus autotrophica]